MTAADTAPWSAPGGAAGVLVVHGFTSTPQSVRPLAEAFAAAGYAVELPLLPGHGTSIDDMATTTWDDWAAAALRAHDALAARCEQVAVAGLSLGGALATLVAIERPAVVAAIVVNPAVEAPPDEVRDAATAMLEGGSESIPAIANDIADPDAVEVGYDAAPLRAVLSLFDGQAKLMPRLGELTCPLLILTSRQDHLVPTTASDFLAAEASGPVERVWLERSYHVATLDYDRDLIGQKAVEFLLRVLH